MTRGRSRNDMLFCCSPRSLLKPSVKLSSMWQGEPLAALHRLQWQQVCTVIQCAACCQCHVHCWPCTDVGGVSQETFQYLPIFADSTMPRRVLTCSLCRWHAGCFKCGFCQKLIGQGTVWTEPSHPGIPYCSNVCLAAVHNPCTVCGKPLTGMVGFLALQLL